MKTAGNEVKVEIIYKDPEGKELTVYRTLTEVLQSDTDEILEQCESPCRSGSCFNEGQNHCDCGGEYEDYSFEKIVIDTAQFKPKWVSVNSQTWNHGETYLTFSPGEGRRYLQYGTQRNGFPHGVTHILPNEYLPSDPLPTKP